MGENTLYLLLSVGLSAGRNLTSKKTAADAKDRSSFFFSQAVLFLSAALILAVFNPRAFALASPVALMQGVVYGVLLILSQWMFTLALRHGSTSVCSVIYSLGFILPTISGAVFWNESFTASHFCGLLMALAVILLTVKRDGCKRGERSFIPFILIAMLSSGGLGIMQKVQQSSQAAEHKGAFLITAFLVAFIASMAALLLCQRAPRVSKDAVIYPALAGGCFGGANLCNTVLAGRMSSAVFFPVQNISTILLSTLLGIILFKEKITVKTAITVALGIAVVVIFSI
jgi:drug/metabolite transporter (DMT)-like permease